MDIHPICLVDEVSDEVVDRFLAATFARSEYLAPGCPLTLRLLETEICDPNAILGQTAEVVSQKLGPEYKHFVILDTRSTEDDTALLVEQTTGDDESVEDSNGIQTVRIPFSEAQIMITALEVGTLGFQDLQDNARAEGGTWRERVKPQQGEPAPRKLLRRLDTEEEDKEEQDKEAEND